jgi:hypothetical protein
MKAIVTDHPRVQGGVELEIKNDQGYTVESTSFAEDSFEENLFNALEFINRIYPTSNIEVKCGSV